MVMVLLQGVCFLWFACVCVCRCMDEWVPDLTNHDDDDGGGGRGRREEEGHQGHPAGQKKSHGCLPFAGIIIDGTKALCLFMHVCGMCLL
jgi:hypothetical protein